MFYKNVIFAWYYATNFWENMDVVLSSAVFVQKKDTKSANFEIFKIMRIWRFVLPLWGVVDPVVNFTFGSISKSQLFDTAFNYMSIIEVL